MTDAQNAPTSRPSATDSSTAPDTSTARHDSTTTADPPEHVVKRAVAASALGNATEWFDYGVYAVAVTYISANFFDGGTFFALATFAVSFLVRPLGGIVWGPLGDRIGRKGVLAATILLMGGATFSIGLLPTSDAVGALAPTLLILLRLIQGFSTGGEYGGAATFMAEYSPDKKRGFFGSFLEFGTLVGFAAGTFLVLALQLGLGQDAMMEWGWRIPFFVAGPIALIGLYLRSKLDDTPVFQEHAESAESTGGSLKGVWRYWRQMLTMAGLVIALNVANYTLISYMPTYLETQIQLSSDSALLLILIGQLAMVAVIPFAGKLSDRVGRRPLWKLSMIGLLVAALPAYMLMGTGFAGALIGFGVLGILYVFQLATISATFPAMFPTHVRFAAFAITYNVATALFGGTAPAINEALIEATGSVLMPAVSMMVACVIGLVALRFLRETNGASIRGTEVPGTAETPVQPAQEATAAR